MKILLKIRYDGAGYCGFQTQPNGITVQEVLTKSFTQLMGFPCRITGCSRTDSGVHALGFCATLEPADSSLLASAWCKIPTEKLHRAINVHLPEDMAVMAAAEVSDGFHPRYSVVSKAYEYHIHNAPYRDPFLNRRVYHDPVCMDDAALEKMKQTARLFVGTHDFSGFMSTGSSVEDCTRTVMYAGVRREEDRIVFRVEADGFLYNMVRIMAGSLLDVAHGRKSEEDIRTAIIEGKRTSAGFTAPPDGLYLCDVHYGCDIFWMCK